MVREVAFADCEETLDRGLKFVVNPDAAHGIVACREDHHRSMVGIIIRDHLIHVEEVAVTVADYIFTETVDCIFEIEVDSVACTDAIAGVAALFGGAACDVTRAEVTECGIAAFEIEVAVFVGNVSRFFLTGADSLGVLFLFGYPDASVVTERFAH